MSERSVRRIVQLEEGIEGATAALPAELAGLGARATAVAARATATARAADETRLADLIAGLERLHYSLLRIAVLKDTSEGAELEARLEELQALAPEDAAAVGSGGATDAS